MKSVLFVSLLVLVSATLWGAETKQINVEDLPTIVKTAADYGAQNITYRQNEVQYGERGELVCNISEVAYKYGEKQFVTVRVSFHKYDHNKVDAEFSFDLLEAQDAKDGQLKEFRELYNKFHCCSRMIYCAEFSLTDGKWQSNVLKPYEQ